MNQALRLNLSQDTLVGKGARVASVQPSTFAGHGFTSERLKAFASRFAPSKETLVQKVSGIGLTAALYVGIATLALELSTANVLPLFHAFHLNGV